MRSHAKRADNDNDNGNGNGNDNGIDTESESDTETLTQDETLRDPVPGHTPSQTRSKRPQAAGTDRSPRNAQQTKSGTARQGVHRSGRRQLRRALTTPQSPPHQRRTTDPRQVPLRRAGRNAAEGSRCGKSGMLCPTPCCTVKKPAAHACGRPSAEMMLIQTQLSSMCRTVPSSQFPLMTILYAVPASSVKICLFPLMESAYRSDSATIDCCSSNTVIHISA